MKKRFKFLRVLVLFFCVNFAQADPTPNNDYDFLNSVAQIIKEWKDKVLDARDLIGVPKEVSKLELPSFLQKIDLSIYDFEQYSNQNIPGKINYYWSVFIPKKNFDGKLTKGFLRIIGLLDWIEDCGLDIYAQSYYSNDEEYLRTYDGYPVYLVKDFYHVRIFAHFKSKNDAKWSIKMYDGNVSSLAVAKGYYFDQTFK